MWQPLDTTRIPSRYSADVYTENKVWGACCHGDVVWVCVVQEKKNALDLGQGADDVNESLLTTRFESEVSWHASDCTQRPACPLFP